MITFRIEPKILHNRHAGGAEPAALAVQGVNFQPGT
jgi:hypothetical protein